METKETSHDLSCHY